MGQASLHIRFKLVSSLLTFVSLFLSQTLLGADNVPAEDFKTFLKSPPVVVRVIIAQRILQVSTPPHRKNPVSPESVTNEIQYFAGAQQPGAFFLRRMRSMGDDAVLIDAAFRTSGLLFSGKNGQRDWFIVNTNISSYVEPSSANSGDDNYVHLTTEGAANILSSILHFGIVNLRDDSLVWQGNHFTATSRNGEELSGDLTTSNDFPQSLTVYNKSKLALQFVADYSFAPASPNGLQIKYIAHILTFTRIAVALPRQALKKNPSLRRKQTPGIAIAMANSHAAICKRLTMRRLLLDRR